MIKESELILNSDGSIYHLGLKPSEIADLIITVGDPDRVDKVTSHFEEILFSRQVREFKSTKGIYRGKEILVISTGIGTDNIDIVFTELDACANIDFKSRSINKKHRSLTFIRLGTSGSLVEDIPLGSFLASEYAMGMDALMNFYQYEKSSRILELEESLKVGLTDGMSDISFYVSAASSDLVNQFVDLGFYKGTTVTAPGFYGPQGRELRLRSKKSKFIEFISKIPLNGTRITNLEMETAGIYGMASALGHKAISLNAILANRTTGEFAKKPAEAVESLIHTALTQIIL